jgi:hypothetical protein
MSNNKFLNLNTGTGFKDDKCEQSAYDFTNKTQLDYYLFESNKQSINSNVLNERGVLSNNIGVSGNKAIGIESKFRNGKDGYTVTSSKSRKTKILPTRSTLTTPFMGFGKTAVVNPKIQADRMLGKDTRIDYKCVNKCGKKKWCDGKNCKHKINGRCECNNMRNTACMCNSYRGVAINRFTPLVPHIKNNVQNPNHIIESWQRGGVDTREYIRNADYLKKFNK